MQETLDLPLDSKYRRPIIRKLVALAPISEMSPLLDGFTGLEACQISAVCHWINHEDSLLRRNRTQLLASCPILAYALANSDPHGSITFDLLGVAVDRGQSLFPVLAEIASVSPCAVRRFSAIAPGVVGEYWREHPIELLRALSISAAFPPPKSNEEWEAFTRYWAASGVSLHGEYNLRTTPQSGHQRDIVGEHVFSQLCRRGYSDRAQTTAGRLAGGSIDNIRDFFDYARYVGEWCSGFLSDDGEHPEDDDDWVIKWMQPQRHERLLVRYSFRELMRQSIEWHRLLVLNQKIDQPGVGILANETQVTWPLLLRQDFVRGNLRCTSVSNYSALRHEGAVLKHCVGNYEAACRFGQSHIVSVRDTQNHPLSTVEIRLDLRSGKVLPVVIQHRGLSNAIPDFPCQEIIDLLIAELQRSDNASWLQELYDRSIQLQKESSALRSATQHTFSEMNAIMEKVLPDMVAVRQWLEGCSPMHLDV